MAQAFRQQTFVQSDGRIEFQDNRLPTGARVEVIVILEEDKPRSAQELAIERLSQLEHPDRWLTVMEPGQDIDVAALKQWIANEQS